LQKVEHTGSASGRLYSPFVGAETSVDPMRLNVDACIVLFGGRSLHQIGAEVCSGLQIFSALLHQEVRTNLTEIKANLSSRTAAESRQLAASLGVARDLLAEASQAKDELLQALRTKDGKRPVLTV
jgi:hypothetical protein